MTETLATPNSAPLPEDFEVTQQAWYKAVAGVFARVQKKDIADVPLDVWQKLIKTTDDGIAINPLYTRADAQPELSTPGTFPFIRGGKATNPAYVGWGVAESFTAGENQQVLNALNNGTTSLVLHAGAAEIEPLLQGVLLDLAPIRLAAGSETAAAAAKLLELVPAETAAEVTLEFGASPLTSAVDGRETATVAEAVALATTAAQQKGDVRAILVDGVSFSNQGATDAEEIGYSIAAGVAYIRLLTEAGLSVADALNQIAFRFAATDDQFAQIAKFRAARGLWARVAEVLGAPEAGSAPQHAVTAPVMFSQRDPWVNMLRSTVAAFAAGVGGATSVEVKPFDYAIAGGMPDTKRSFAARIARNTNLLLLEESHLGFVKDPAGGSYYVEALTDELAEKAWEIFTSVEAAGGYQAVLADGSVQARLDASAERTRDQIAKRIKKVTGINEFPNLLEAPLPAEKAVEPQGVRRWAAQFESFRNRSDAFLAANGKRPEIGLIPLGPLARHNIRTGFTTNLLASGGIASLNPGQVEPGTPEFAAAATAAPIVVICGTDDEYAANGVAVVSALREAGAGKIFLAGSPQSFADQTVTPDGYLNMKIDAAAQLAAFLDELGA